MNTQNHFRKGDAVMMSVSGAGVISYEDHTVKRVLNGVVYLEDSEITFHQDGKATEAGVFGFSFKISKEDKR